VRKIENREMLWKIFCHGQINPLNCSEKAGMEARPEKEIATRRTGRERKLRTVFVAAGTNTF
jgi:hypothetical protein